MNKEIPGRRNDNIQLIKFRLRVTLQSISVKKIRKVQEVNETLDRETEEGDSRVNKRKHIRFTLKMNLGPKPKDPQGKLREILVVA